MIHVIWARRDKTAFRGKVLSRQEKEIKIDLNGTLFGDIKILS